MRRSSLFFGVLLLGAASVANGQALTMMSSNGWTFSFSGNVNIFAMYTSYDGGGDFSGSPALVPDSDAQGLYYGTGLLPAFATFQAKGKEGNTDLGVQFGFAPQVQCGGNNHDCFGAQIDMRQVFMTVGGGWGTITAGKELGVFQRQNILNDQTLFGVGGTGAIAPSGTTLGRIGTGYIYPNFVPQFTYSTTAGKPLSLSIGLMEPSTIGSFNELTLPRLEAEATYKTGSFTLFASGALENANDPVADESETAYGLAGGATFKGSSFSLHGSAYFGSGIGTTLMFLNGQDVDGDLTDSYGGYVQATLNPGGGKTTFAASYGLSNITFDAGGQSLDITNSLISGGLYYQATKSLKLVFEGDYMTSGASLDPGGDAEDNTAFTGSFGMMLFY